MQKNPVLFYREGTCALGSIIALLWLDQPFQLCRLESDKDVTGGDFEKLNALDLVPTLFIDGVVISENIAVLPYLGLKAIDRGLYFEPGTAQFDQLNRAIGFLASDLHKSFGAVLAPKMFHPDPAVQKEIKENFRQGQLKTMIQHANDHLLRTTFFYDRPTVGDAYLFAISQWMEKLYDVKREFPHVFRFREAMLKDNSVIKALAIDSGKLIDADGSAFLGHVDPRAFTHQAVARKAEVDRATGFGAAA